MKSRIIYIFIITGLVLILSSCFPEVDDLSQDNAEYILDEYDTLIYLYNQTDTCKVSIESGFSEGYIYYNMGLRGINHDKGVSVFYMPYSIYKVVLNVFGKSDVIHLWITLTDKKSSFYHYSEQTYINLMEKSELINNRTILNINYINCYIYNSDVSPKSNEIGIQSYIYNKEYGIVQLIMKDSTRFELIGAK